VYETDPIKMSCKKYFWVGLSVVKTWADSYFRI